VTESDPTAAKAAAEEFRAVHLKIKKEVQRVIVGQEKVIDAVLTALVVGGHVMLEGVPGLGKTMLEKQITVGKRTIKLEEPFCVMSTQNPIEQEGTYPLPEAQLDRFLFKIIVDYPAVSDYRPILERTTGNEEVHASHVSTGEEVMRMREIVRGVPVPDYVQDYAVHLVVATQPKSEFATPLVNQNVLLGSSPRGAQGLLLAGKVQALLARRFAVSTDDIRAVALDVLRHRIIVNFQGQAEGFTPDHIIEDVLAYVNVPANA
jgi:MoxR-like ATPase